MAIVASGLFLSSFIGEYLPMLIKRSCHIVSLVLITAALMPSLSGDAEAQVDGAKPAAKNPLGRSSLNKFKERAAKPATSPEKPGAKPAVDGAAPQRKAPEAAQAPGLAGWIRQNWEWVVGLPLGVAALGLSWFLLAGKRRKEDGVGALLKPISAGSESGNEGTERFSSTRIRAADVDTRLSGSLDGEEVETDQDYALVVEEGALSATDPQDAGSPEEVIDAYLQGEDFVAAYETYARLLEEASSTRLDSGLEQRLGESLVANGQVEKAVTVLEHHIATHPADEIEATAYFNLGYSHFHSRHLEKSRKFFGLFIDAEEDETRRERARAILAAMETDQA